MNNFTYQIPTRFVFGRGAENQVGAEVRAQGGTKVLIHYGGGSAVRSGLIDRVKKSLDEANIQHIELGSTTAISGISSAERQSRRRPRRSALCLRWRRRAANRRIHASLRRKAQRRSAVCALN